MFAIFKKELKSFFYSPIAYVVIGLFELVMALFFYIFNFSASSSDISTAFLFGGFLLIAVVPLLTMRLIAEDRRSGVEVLLLTSPTSITGIVLGKYLAAFTVFAIMTAVTAIFPLLMLFFGPVAVAQILTTYLGFLLLGAAFIAVGVFASSLTENQIIAAIIGFVAILILYFMSLISNAIGGTAAIVINWISLSYKYGNFPSGILDLSDIVFFASFIAIFLFLTVRIIERRRWSQG